MQPHNRRRLAWLALFVGLGAAWWALRPADVDAVTSAHREVGAGAGPELRSSPQRAPHLMDGESEASAAPPPTAPPDADELLAGVVLDDESGAPIEGARVFVGPPGSGFVPAHGSVQTDADGHFALRRTPAPGSEVVAALGAADRQRLPAAVRPPAPLAPHATEPHAAPQHVHVLAHGYRPWTRVAPATEPLEVRLEAGSEIRGVVVDGLGRAIPGARVLAARIDNRVLRAADEERDLLPTGAYADAGRGIADAQGRFVIRGLARGQVMNLRAAAPDTYGWITRDVTAPAQGVVLELCRRTSARLSVVDAITSQPIELFSLELGIGARVMPLLSSGSASARWHSGDSWVSPTQVRILDFYDDIFGHDQGGRETLDAQVPLTLDVAAPGYERAQHVARLERGRSTEVVVALARPAHASPRPLSVEVGLANGLGFDGTLTLEVRPEAVGDSRHVAQQTLRFRQGRPGSAVQILPGRYRFRLVSSWTADVAFTAWEHPTETVLHAVPSDREAEPLRFALAGNPARLDVRDAEGARVVGYDLIVRRPGQADATAHHAWHALQTILANQPGSDPGLTLWLPRGPGRLGAALPGAGRAEVPFEADGSGHEILLRIDLPGRIGDAAPEGGTR